MKKISTILFLIVALGIGLIFYQWRAKPAEEKFATYFSYSEAEVQALDELRSNKEMSVEEIYRWADTAKELVSKGTLVTGFDPNTSKIYAYLAVAQRDAAALSFNAKQKFAGSLAPVSKEVLCVFFASECHKINVSQDRDEYSDAIAKVILVKVRARISEDEASRTPYPKKIGFQYWDGPEPQIGITDGNNKPWLIKSGGQFRADPPPASDSAEFKKQLAEVKRALQNATEDQKRAVAFWAGGPGTMTTPGIWLRIADDYMKKNQVSFEKTLRVRSALAMALADANTAVFDSKYTYWVKRPFMVDPSIISIMPTPNHPSYPAGHSALSGAAFGILDSYFPENSTEWRVREEEGGMSRIWGGIHFPMDNRAGTSLGEKVAEEGLKELIARNLY